jgi:iron complex outermembrane recepter protein
MPTDHSLRKAVHCALLTSAAAAALTHSAHAADDTIQEVIVTGSRISVPNMQSISPVTAISSEDISVTGKIRIEDILNQMPQAFAAQGSTISAGIPEKLDQKLATATAKVPVWSSRADKGRASMAARAICTR